MNAVSVNFISLLSILFLVFRPGGNSRSLTKKLEDGVHVVVLVFGGPDFECVDHVLLPQPVLFSTNRA